MSPGFGMQIGLAAAGRVLQIRTLNVSSDKTDTEALVYLVLFILEIIFKP